MIVEDRTADGYFSVKNYIVFYFLYINVFIIEFQYWHLVQSIGRRFKRLNECLEEGNCNNKLVGQMNKNNDKLKNLFTIKLGEIQEYPSNNKHYKLFVQEMIGGKRNNEINKICFKNSLNYSHVEFIPKLSEAHGKLFEAVNTVNEVAGFLSLVRYHNATQAILFYTNLCFIDGYGAVH